MTKTAAYVLAATLDKHGVDVAYCVPGESYLPLTDADRRILAAKVNTLAEDLSTLRGKLGLA